MKNGPFTALIAGLTAVIVGGGVATAYEVVVVPSLKDRNRETASLLIDIGTNAFDIIEACKTTLDEQTEAILALSDAYGRRSDATDDFFTRGGLWAGDADWLYFELGSADSDYERAMDDATWSLEMTDCYDRLPVFDETLE